MKQRELHGRNEHGFVIGSPQAEQFQRMLDREMDEDAPTTQSPKRSTARAVRRTDKLRRRLKRPDWWDDAMPATQAKNRRYLARQAAKRAAEKLGVEVPEWVDLHVSWGGARQRRVTPVAPIVTTESDVIVSHLRWRLHSIEEEAEG